MDNIGLRLQNLRNQQGLSQRKLARSAGVSNATISLIEHGRTDPSMGLLKRILDAMGVSFADFFSEPSRHDEKYFLRNMNSAGSAAGRLPISKSAVTCATVSCSYCTNATHRVRIPVSPC